MRFLIPLIGCFMIFPLITMQYPESRQEGVSDHLVFLFDSLGMSYKALPIQEIR